MRKLLLIIGVLSAAVSVRAQNLAWNGFCEDGGVQVSTSGLLSTTKVQASYPKCTVTVYLTGTTTLASIFTNGPGAPLANPFQANIDGSILFFANPGACYDIVTSASTSGGTPVMPNPFTYTDVCLGSGGGGGGGGVFAGTFKIVPNCTAAGTVANQTVQESSQLVGGVSTTCATVGGLNSTSIIGVCSTTGIPTGIAAGCGNTGNAFVVTGGTTALTLDNTGTQGDYIVPSTTVVGFGSDAGAIKPTGLVETLGNVSTPNAGGAGNAAQVQVAPLSLLLPGATGSGSITNCTGITGPGPNAYYSGLNIVSCDLQFTDNGVGVFTAIGGNFDGPGAGFVNLFQGTLPTFPPVGAIQFTAPTVVTAYQNIFPGAAASGCVQVNNVANVVTWSFTGFACGSGSSSYVLQINGSTLTNGDTVNFNNSTPAPDPGFTNVTWNKSTVSTTDSVSAELLVPGGSQVPQPPAPTLTVGGTPGGATVTYVVVACQDSPCAYHTQASSTATVNTANATLSLSPITLKAYNYASNGTSVRCYNIYRTVGGPSQGLIANCVWTQFIDTGLAGDSTTAPITNTTQIFANPQPLPGCNTAEGGVFGIDAPTCVMSADTDEFTWTGNGTFAPADANDPFWAWLNQNSATITLTNGLGSLSSPSRGSTTLDNLNCLIHPAPATPYTFVGLYYYTNTIGAINAGGGTGMTFYDSVSGRLESIGIQASNSATNDGRMVVVKWTNTTTQSSVPALGFPGMTPGNPIYFKLQDNGTNITLSYSSDGIVYVVGFTEGRTTFLTNGANNIGFCVDNSTGANLLDADYFRRTQ